MPDLVAILYTLFIIFLQKQGARRPPLPRQRPAGFSSKNAKIQALLPKFKLEFWPGRVGSNPAPPARGPLNDLPTGSSWRFRKRKRSACGFFIEKPAGQRPEAGTRRPPLPRPGWEPNPNTAPNRPANSYSHSSAPFFHS